MAEHDRRALGRTLTELQVHGVVDPAVPGNPTLWVEPRLPEALSRLSERQRVSVVLVHSLGFTFAETAELLGVSIGTVETHVMRGLRRLRRSLGVKT